METCCFFSNIRLLSVLFCQVSLKVARGFARIVTVITARLFSGVIALVYFQGTSSSTWIFAMITFERFLSRMCHYVALEVASLFEGFSTLSAVERLISWMNSHVHSEISTCCAGVRKCFLRVLFCAQEKSHWVHLKSFSPEWVLTCFFMLLASIHK